MINLFIIIIIKIQRRQHTHYYGYTKPENVAKIQK